MQIRRLVLDVLKSYEPDIIVMAKKIASCNGVDGVNISVYEIDKKVENVKITIEGTFDEWDKIKKVIEQCGATIHSIDEVATGPKIVKESETLQERI